jgi:hypothetical protein
MDASGDVAGDDGDGLPGPQLARASETSAKRSMRRTTRLLQLGATADNPVTQRYSPGIPAIS